MNILSIESSCDDSAVSLTDSLSAKLLWDRKISQEAHHHIHGGVVPEIASRLFAKDLVSLVQSFSDEVGFERVDCISFTNEPGLSTSLLEGMMAAKALSISLDVPLVPINHLKGHVYSLFINQREAIMPLSVLLVSGGHSMILECFSYHDMRVVSSTLDDSFGECYDKASKMLSLGYPGGMIIDSIAKDAESEGIDSIELPIPLLHDSSMNFSFSGLKNAFRLKVKDNKELLSLMESGGREDIKSHKYVKALCRGLQRSAVKHVILKYKKYLESSQIKHVAIVGGASANSLLRAQMQNLCDRFNKTLILSDLAYCSDNAAMIGRACMAAVSENCAMLESSMLDIDISPRSSFYNT